MQEFKAPEEITFSFTSIFLAGSIEMGKAELWQDTFVKRFADTDCVIYNPRRDDWDSSWEQTKENAQFREQVEWELNALQLSQLIVVYFDPNTQSPITLMELGLHARSAKNMIVCCPEGYFRKGNVDIVCEKYGVKQAKNFDELLSMARTTMGYTP